MNIDITLSEGIIAASSMDTWTKIVFSSVLQVQKKESMNAFFRMILLELVTAVQYISTD